LVIAGVGVGVGAVTVRLTLTVCGVKFGEPAAGENVTVPV